MAQDHGTADGRRKSRRGFGFTRAAAAAEKLLREAGASRGFAEHRVLTDWATVAGPEFAALCRPVKMTWRGRDHGLGATLVVLVEGARAAEVTHLADRIIERVNRVHGHKAVTRLKVVQTHDGAAAPGACAESAPPAPPVEPSVAVAAVADAGLREALARLEANIRARAAARALPIPDARGLH